jgi:hypothetical protein
MFQVTQLWIHGFIWRQQLQMLQQIDGLYMSMVVVINSVVSQLLI